MKHRGLARQRPLLLLQNPLTASKHPHNSLSSCSCSLFVRISVLKHLDADINDSKPLSQLRNHRGPLLKLTVRLLSCFKGALLLNFNQTVKCKLLIMGVK